MSIRKIDGSYILNGIKNKHAILYVNMYQLRKIM